MSILITSDIQAEWSNLDLCQQAWDECLSICKERDIKIITNLGDGKESYNPVDIRVVRWWQDAIRQARKRSIDILWNLGNHDRVGQYTDADNWLPILRRAGAATFDTPTVKDIGWCRLFILPFSRASEAKRNIQRFLKEKPDREKDILLFHHDLKGILYNQYGSTSDANLSFNDINSSKFRFCVGGHIHNPQNDGNVYFVGAPFCHDWGEVNQRKRYLVVGKDGIRSILSHIPGWFDPYVDGFKHSTSDIKSWRGTKVRLSVLCDAGEDYGRHLEKARREAERKFRGATIYVVPKFKDSRQTELGISVSDTDERKVREYIRQTRQSNRKLRQEDILNYMLEKLANFSGGLRTNAKTKFISAKGINFLPFKKVNIDFTDKGITVIQGINEDRNGKSNGAAKTSLIQLPPVAMFGRTFKDQQHDKWANRWTDDTATSEVKLIDHKGRKIKIIRGRRPPMLKMSIDGKDQSSGMKSNDKDGTQAQIEQITGFTWQTLANAVYIDRSVADAFLSGTNKQRTDVLSRFQNLERFASALELVKKDERKNKENSIKIKEKIARVRGAIEESKESLRNLVVLNKGELYLAYKEYEKRRKELKKFYIRHSFKSLEVKANKIHKKYDIEVDILRSKEKQLAISKSDLARLENEGLKFYKLKKKHKCPTCLQKVNRNWLNERSTYLKANYKVCLRYIDLQLDRLSKVKNNVQVLDGEYTELQRELGKLDNEKRLLEGYVKTSKRQWMELNSETHSVKIIISKSKRKLQRLNHDKRLYKSRIKKYTKLSKLYEYVSEAFSRDGIPAFLNRQLCPILNKAADYYADIFSDREIQLQFSIDKGEFVPRIINVKGGEGIDDQSTGERALAGLIASFALREVAPKCNILMLDEPGEGLDQQTAKQFARALQKLKHRFGSIFICTHNVHILSELSGERVITVVKKNKISKVLEG